MAYLRLVTLLTFLLSSSVWACEFKSVTFHNNFSAAGLDSCEQTGMFEYELWIKPENTPINPSAWYALQVSATHDQQIYVTIRYKDNGRHRYTPKVSQDGQQWQALAHEVTTGRIDGKRHSKSVSFQLQVSKTPVWVSAQEIINYDHYNRWMMELEQAHDLKRYQISESVDKRAIWALESRADSNEWLILIGRQHPPEVTGALGMMPFVETVLSALPVAEKFREQYNILIIPLVNPDGVERGHWRHNVGGKDLNRNWGELSEPEVIGIHNRFQDIVKQGGKIVYAVDFHSTWRSLFYTMPEDYDLEDPTFSSRWLASLAQTLPNFEVDERPGISKNPGVFKQYIADAYGVHSVTYEVGDRSDRNEIRLVAKTSAMLLMKQMLK